ncbi:DUF732 domain-containing protein [Mycolicibacterium chlorophenolicum]|uniref:DUF732 domain-containing protein n=1 Tax=Mycolicibacterium chlorophenolicum TaxID=37916 RepID=A0A0J6WME0_9MYCO|nr:DUF732 domain-containing protein [Mycolicibacterium chlorophenolicum]KMO83764.1 hypothetical protein MCHLDSM_00224 [Mycolicibacterium chlorophenolicum]
MNTPTTATVLGLHVAGLALAALLGSPPAQADTVAYLVNVTVRPGYNFRSADDAIAYGRGLCARISSGQSYAEVMTAVKSDFNNPDEYQASYLITQAANELCPAQIWQLRNSAAHYQPPTP